MIGDRPPDHADLDLGVEQDQIDSLFQRSGGGVVRGVEKAQVGELDLADVAPALDPHRTEVGAAAAAEVVERPQRLQPRPEHGVDQVAPGTLAGQHPGEEIPPLVGQAALLGEHAAGLLGQGGRPRDQSRIPLAARTTRSWTLIARR